MNPKITQVSVDPVSGFFFLHYLASVVIGISINPQNFQSAFLTAQNMLSRELAKYEDWKKSGLVTEQSQQQYFIRMRDRVLNEIITLQRLNGAGATNPPAILKPNGANPT